MHSRLSYCVSEANMLKMDGFDSAVLGLVRQPNGETVIAYSEEKIIETLCEQMTLDEAYEYYSFNIQSAYMGSGTPLIIEDMTMDEIHLHADEYGDE